MSTVVKAEPGESADSLIRKFNKKVMSEGVLIELKKREFYLKPSTRRQQEAQAKRRGKR